MSNFPMDKVVEVKIPAGSDGCTIIRNAKKDIMNVLRDGGWITFGIAGGKEMTTCTNEQASKLPNLLLVIEDPEASFPPHVSSLIIQQYHQKQGGTSGWMAVWAACLHPNDPDIIDMVRGAYESRKVLLPPKMEERGFNGTHISDKDFVAAMKKFDREFNEEEKTRGLLLFPRSFVGARPASRELQRKWCFYARQDVSDPSVAVFLQCPVQPGTAHLPELSLDMGYTKGSLLGVIFEASYKGYPTTRMLLNMGACHGLCWNSAMDFIKEYEKGTPIDEIEETIRERRLKEIADERRGMPSLGEMLRGDFDESQFDVEGDDDE